MIATKKGVNPERGSQVDFMADFQEMLDFPPAPKLDILGKLDPKATHRDAWSGDLQQGAMRDLPPAALYTDNLMHNLQSERFFCR